MRKNKVTSFKPRGKVGKQARAGAPTLPRGDNDLLGWLIFCPEHDDFLHSHSAGVGYSSEAYTAEPAFAYVFGTEALAFRYASFIERVTEVVPLFDLGDKLGVGFSKPG